MGLKDLFSNMAEWDPKDLEAGGIIGASMAAKARKKAEEMAARPKPGKYCLKTCAVNDGQLLIIVEDGKIVDFTAEQGGYEYDFHTEPSAFCGSFGAGLKSSFEQMRARLAFGGRAGKDQRAYFVNTKEILNNRFGFGNLPYRDSEFDLTITLKGYGTYVFRIVDPIVFYTNISGNVHEKYNKSDIAAQMQAELRDALLPALGYMARCGVKYDEIASNAQNLTDLLREKMRVQWRERRGIEIVSISMSNIIPDEESIDKIREL